MGRLHVMLVTYASSYEEDCGQQLHVQLRAGRTSPFDGAGAGALQPLDTCVCVLQGTGKATLVNLVDIPGHPRVRRGFEQHLRSTQGIVFVVDALGFLPHKTETAE